MSEQVPGENIRRSCIDATGSEQYSREPMILWLVKNAASEFQYFDEETRRKLYTQCEVILRMAL